MTPTEARRFVLMDMLDRAAHRADAWRAAATTGIASAVAIANAWDNTHANLLTAIAKCDAESPTETVGITRAEKGAKS
jgi:hypothetical protein